MGKTLVYPTGTNGKIFSVRYSERGRYEDTNRAEITNSLPFRKVAVVKGC
jgi:hypothetical protein